MAPAGALHHDDPRLLDSRLSMDDARSSSAVIVGKLSKFSQEQQSAEGIVGTLNGLREKRERKREDDAFLERLAVAEQANPFFAPTSAEPQAAASSASSPPAAGEKKKAREKRLTREEAATAAEIFWDRDIDASSTIDRAEWERLVVSNETLSRSMSVTIDEAFLRADKDGNGEIQLNEFLQSREARKLATAAKQKRLPDANAPLRQAMLEQAVPSSSGGASSGAARVAAATGAGSSSDPLAYPMPGNVFTSNAFAFDPASLDSRAGVMGSGGAAPVDDHDGERRGRGGSPHKKSRHRRKNKRGGEQRDVAAAEADVDDHSSPGKPRSAHKGRRHGHGHGAGATSTHGSPAAAESSGGGARHGKRRGSGER